MLKQLQDAAGRQLNRLRRRAEAKAFEPYIKSQTVIDSEFKLLIGDIDGRDWYDPPQPSSEPWIEMLFIRDRLI